MNGIFPEAHSERVCRIVHSAPGKMKQFIQVVKLAYKIGICILPQVGMNVYMCVNLHVCMCVCVCSSFS